VIIYLVRHAIAVEHGTPGFADDERPLTEEGIDRMQRGARGLARFVDPPELIVSSPLLRARQTAEILAVALQSRHALTEWTVLTPDATPTQTMTHVNKHASENSTMMLVGHEPHLSALAATLLGASADAIAFKKGGACAIECPIKVARGTGKLLWLLTPKQLRQLA